MEYSDGLKKELKRFKTSLSFYTEGVSYFVLIPVSVLYAWLNLNLNGDQVLIMLKCAAAAVIISTPTTLYWDHRISRPLVAYFKKCLEGESVPEEEYEAAQKRFFSLPYYHAFGSFLRWVYGLSLAIVPMIYLASLSSTQVFNVLMLYAVIPPVGGVIFFFLTEIYMQKLLNLGLFNRIVLKEFRLRIRFETRILITVLIMLSIPIISVICYFTIIIDAIKPDYSYSFIRLAGLLLFSVFIGAGLLWPLLKTINDKINTIIRFLQSVGAGDLAVPKAIIAVVDDLTTINQTVYMMKKNITEMIHDISNISIKLDVATHEISQITQSFTEDTQNQAATVEEVTSTIEEISAAMDSISTSANTQVGSLQSLAEKMGELSGTIRGMDQEIATTESLAVEISNQARQGEESLGRMNQSMDKIRDSSTQMANIINIINDISDKINLLSLNAAIEAARAGEAGRGFAVVADEISKLADSTASSVKEIDGLIKASEDEIVRGMAITTDVVGMISGMTGGISSMNTMMQRISDFMKRQTETNLVVERNVNEVRVMSDEIQTATQQQKYAMGEVVAAVNRINELTQSISSGSEEIAANTDRTAGMADSLKKKVDMFKLA